MALAPVVRSLPPVAAASPDHSTARAVRLSVVIVNFNSWEETGRLVARLRASAAMRDGRAEIVVVDNRSDWHPLIPRLRRMPGVSLRRWRRNQGFGRAVNEGVRLGVGDWCLVLNPDIDPPDDFLDRVMDRLDAVDRLSVKGNPAGIVGFRLRNVDSSPQWSVGPFPTLWRTVVGQVLPRARRKYQPLRTTRPRPVSWVTGCCILVRRECFRSVGGFGPGFFLYYEDVDLCRRAHQAGWSVWFDPAVWAIHERPLHLRAVPPRTRVMVRHGQLAYALAHWPRWQAQILGGLIRCEAAVRHLRASLAGDDEGRSWARAQIEVIRVAERFGPVAARRRLMRWLDAGPPVRPTAPRAAVRTTSGPSPSTPRRSV